MEEDKYFYNIDLNKIYNYTKPNKIIIKGHETQIDNNLTEINPITDIPLQKTIKYICETNNDKLKDYIYVEPLLIKDIPLGSSIAYISKKTFSKKC